MHCYPNYESLRLLLREGVDIQEMRTGSVGPRLQVRNYNRVTRTDNRRSNRHPQP